MGGSSASCGGEANVRLPVGVDTVPEEGDAGEDTHEGLEDRVGTNQVAEQDTGEDDHVANSEALEEDD